MRNGSVLTLTGYYHPLVGNDSHPDIMGVYYFNSVENIVNDDSSNKMLPGSPNQKILHQAVMTLDKKSVYIFRGLSFDNLTQTNASVIEFDISPSTFISHGNFSYVGGSNRCRPHIRTDLVILNTTSWTWFSPNISGIPINGRYGHLYEDNTLIIEGGAAGYEDRRDISVLRNLPFGDESSEMDHIYNDNDDTDKSILILNIFFEKKYNSSISLAMVLYYVFTYIFRKFINIILLKIWKIEDFELGRLLGESPYSRIHSAREKESRCIVALKCLDKKLIQEKRLEQQIIQEIENQKMIKHPNVIQLYNYFDSDAHLTLILELAPHGDLFSRLKTSGIFNEQDTAKYIRDVCNGLAYLHQKRIIHRDVKLENILLGLKDEAKIGDFGCSLRKSYKTNSDGLEDGNDGIICGTLDYLAPEMIRGARYNEKVDSWAIGVVIYECMCGYAPFGLDDSKESYSTTETHILEGTISFPDHLGGDCIDLITKLLTTDPSKRLAVRGAMNHPFIKVNHNKRSLLL